MKCERDSLRVQRRDNQKLRRLTEKIDDGIWSSTMAPAAAVAVAAVRETVREGAVDAG